VYIGHEMPRCRLGPKGILYSASSCLHCELIAWRISVSGLLGAHAHPSIDQSPNGFSVGLRVGGVVISESISGQWNDSGTWGLGGGSSFGLL